MMQDYGSYWTTPTVGASFLGAWAAILFIPLLIWSIFWKGWGLWRAAKNDSKVWYVAILLLNTLGILEILYLFVFGKKKPSKKSK